MISKTALNKKSSTEQIRERFDADVERFSKLETGQQSAMDAVLILDLIAKSAANNLVPGSKILDIGCGAGNFTMRLLSEISPINCVLNDLSQPMLARANERVSNATTGSVETIQSDMRNLKFEPESFDCILAGQVLHHLREDSDWEMMFCKLHYWLKPGGTVFIADFITFDDPTILKVMLEHYSNHLISIGGEEYREKVLAYIDIEDSPRSLKFQLQMLQTVGFSDYDILHRNSMFGAIFARK